MRLVSLYVPLLIVTVCLTSCEFKCTVGNDSKKETPEKTSGYKPIEKDGAAIYNGIKVSSNKVHLSKAYLINRDDATAIEEGNFVDIKQGVKLVLMIDSGWVLKENKASLGAALKVTSENGEVLLDKKDMFEGTGEISDSDSKILGLSVYFTDWKATTPVTLNVEYRVWDKNSDAYVEGSYIIHTK